MADQFVYVTYIRTTAEKLWEALIEPEFTRQYWFGVVQVSDWNVGASWALQFADGRVADTGEVLEFDPPRRLAVKWRNEFRPELKEEGYSHCEIELEPKGEVVKLTVRHTMEMEKSKLIEAVGGGWPHILSNLKTLLETGRTLPQEK
jgi:uncharacterized protein YndB with AHSA1/START domain